MNTIFHRITAITGMLLCCMTVVGAAEPAPKRPQPERWLLIVDVSADMSRRSKAVEGVVEDLLNSGMNGQMHPGDELGIWTYNKSLYAGVAPLQSWDPGRSNVIVRRTTAYLSKQVFRSKSQIEPVLSELAGVVEDSRRMTVLLFSDGSQKISGTPYDEAINAASATHLSTLAQTRMPLVTVLRVEKGKYIGHSVSIAPWPVEFPAFPADPVPKPEPVAAPVQARPVESIIMKGPTKKPEPTRPTPVVTRGGSADLLKRDTPQTSGSDEPSPVSEAVATPPPHIEPVAAVAPLTVPADAPVPAVVPVAPVPVPKPITPAPASAAKETVPVNKPVVTTPSPMAPDISAPKIAPFLVAPPTAPVAQTVTIRKWPLILGISCMWLAVVVAAILARRMRRANASSLITRSLDRPPK